MEIKKTTLKSVTNNLKNLELGSHSLHNLTIQIFIRKLVNKYRCRKNFELNLMSRSKRCNYIFFYKCYESVLFRFFGTNKDKASSFLNTLFVIGNRIFFPYS